MRADSLAKTQMLPMYPGGDYRLIAELALQGRIVEIRESQFLRRVHDGSVSQQFRKTRQATGYFPTSGKRITNPTSRLAKDLLKTVLKAKMPLRHKLNLSISLFKRLYWDRRQIIKELLGSA